MAGQESPEGPNLFYQLEVVEKNVNGQAKTAFSDTLLNLLSWLKGPR